MLRDLRPDHPVYCVYPQVYRATTRQFLHGFPGRVLYAVKANNEPLVMRTLLESGVRHFDCASLVEVEQVRAISDDAVCYFMNPVRIRGAARVAQEKHGVRHFVVDHPSGLLSLLQEIDAGRSVIFARMAVHHKTAMVDLSSKFGAKPDDVVELLHAIAEHGAEPALAFNVGSVVMSPDAFVHAMDIARSVLDRLPFKVRLVDIGGGYPKSYPGFAAPPLDDYFAAIKGVSALPLHDEGELLAEPGRALSARGTSAVVQVLLRKDDRLYLNDGMYGAFWELRFKGHERFAARAFRGHAPLVGATRLYQLFGPTCDSGDAMPGQVELPADIDVGDHIEFGSIGAYSLSGRTDFNGFYSNTVVQIDATEAWPPD
ncbi:MAG: type III PLP-dependent enzyme [Gammaproteobacteria bacterium]|nr:type III PLP-dependent enzyme [Gammaproteobacteria bacterium]